jgi:protein-S-isoprenylcysteine O-methyltransferase Ste14
MAFDPKIIVFLLGSVSVVLVLWSVYAMRSSNLNVFPDVRRGSSLIRQGPYKIIRHPMYLAVILFSISLLLTNVNLLRILTLALLIIDLVIKIEYEETLLIKEFPDYSKYKVKTYKLIPLIY